MEKRQKCFVCGCTDEHACPGGCFWAGENLCSTCLEDVMLTAFPGCQQVIPLPVPIGEKVYAVFGYGVYGVEELRMAGYVDEGGREFYLTYDEDMGSCDVPVKDAFATREEALKEATRRQNLAQEAEK